MIIQERKTDNIEMRQPHADRQGQSRGAEKTPCWFPVNSLEHKLRGALALEPTDTHTHTHTHTRARARARTMQPSAPSGEGGARALTVAAENALKLATGRGGRAEPACALATVVLPQGSGGGGGPRDPSEPISSSWGGCCGERSVLQWPDPEGQLPWSHPEVARGLSLPSLLRPVSLRACARLSHPVSASPHFLPTGTPLHA